MRQLLGLTAMLVFVVATRADVSDATKKLASKNSSERRQAAQDLSEAGASAKPALDALIKALANDDEDRFVRTYAARAIGNIGPDAKKAIPALAAGLQTGHANVRLASIKALAKMGEEAIPVLGKSVLTGANDLHETAVGALAAMGKPAFSVLLEILKEPKVDTSYRRTALASMVKQTTELKASVKTLTAIAKNPRGAGQEGQLLRQELFTALGEVAGKSDGDTIKLLESIASDMRANAQMKKAAATALKKIEAR